MFVREQDQQKALFQDSITEGTIPMTEHFNPESERLATMISLGSELLDRMCEDELNFSRWRSSVKKGLSRMKVRTDEGQIDWLQKCLAGEPKLKERLTGARKRLNDRLAREPVFIAGEVIALFMYKRIDKKAILLDTKDMGEPTVEVELLEPLRFCCNRGDIFEVQESPVIARIEATKIPNFRLS